MPKIEKKNTNLACLKKHISNAILHANKIDVSKIADLKFKKTMQWPYPQEGTCNFIEFINQLFTTVASIKAIEYLNLNAEKDDWVMNLGTTPGRDLTVIKDGKNIIAEIFAVTDPQSNDKLKDEIISLATLSDEIISLATLSKEEEDAYKRYAFFILSEDKFPKEEKSVIPWTTYKQSSNGNISIKFKDKSFYYDGNENMAMWTAKCQSDTQPEGIEVNIVCWSSENCLFEFL